jgi:hypothetical protein
MKTCGGEGALISGFERLTVCRFHGARGGVPEGKRRMAITGTAPEPSPPSSFGGHHKADIAERPACVY